MPLPVLSRPAYQVSSKGTPPVGQASKTATGIETVRAVTSTDIFKTQVGGDHYTRMSIQPIEYALANNMTFIEANVVKYVSRWRFKGGVQDLKKAQHMLGLLIAHEEKREEGKGE